MDRHHDLQETSFRLFPEAPRADFEEQGLRDLAELMIRDQSGTSDIPAGFTYFGQFITHDISRVSLDRPTGRFVPKPSLDLDCVYGNGFYDERAFVDRLTGKMVLGKTGGVGRRRDLPRDSTGKALVPDPRNDENTIVAQFHVQWLRLHNRLVDKADATLRSAHAKFEFARKRTVALYQYLVVHSFLAKLSNEDVFREVLGSGNTWLWSPLARTPSIVPIEFAGAAFRFGHSMVTSAYDLTPRKKVLLEEVLWMSGRLGMAGQRQLPDDWVIDWRVFFELDSSVEPVKAFTIDPKIVKRLSNIEGNPDSLAFRNLSRGCMLKLPSGQDLARSVSPRLKRSPLKVKVFDQLKDFREAKYYESETKVQETTLFRRHNFHKQTPLWYYLLAEDYLENPGDPDRGSRLGTLASLIVCETIRGLLVTTPESIYTELGEKRLKYVVKHVLKGAAPTMENLLKAL